MLLHPPTKHCTNSIVHLNGSPCHATSFLARRTQTLRQGALQHSSLLRDLRANHRFRRWVTGVSGLCVTQQYILVPLSSNIMHCSVLTGEREASVNVRQKYQTRSTGDLYAHRKLEGALLRAAHSKPTLQSALQGRLPPFQMLRS